MLLLAGAAIVVALALGIGQPDTAPATRLSLAIGTAVLLAPLFCDDATSTSQALTDGVVAWALVVLLTGIAVASLGAAIPLARLGPLLLVALGILVVTRLATRVSARLLGAVGLAAPASREWARWLVVAALWLLAAAPLWLGPLAALDAGAGPGRASMIVAASPLVHLAIAAGQDLLRTQWWYAHTSFGSLQFDYPSLAAVVPAYAVAALALAGLDFLVKEPSR